MVPAVSVLLEINLAFNSLRLSDKCITKLTIIGSDNGLAPGRRQANIRTTDGILLKGPLMKFW